ncbi:hypothetical protein OG195_40945 [Streptomyces sp. NBC_01362]|uniref:hypothetical protein n=1 Tax=Streptomyces sp. NBC_01362 TaxID=2903839 RepID=UPI002E339838|nr:hypothetical protein [Streptomyces sp. NBC_01362]
MPGIPSWLHDVHYLDIMVLSQPSDAIEDTAETTGGAAGLADAPFQAAADAISNLATDLPQSPADSPVAGPEDTSDMVFLRAVPAWETAAL